MSSASVTRAFVFALLVNAILAANCTAADVRYFLVVKGQFFAQTGTGAPSPQGAMPYLFNTEVALRLPGLVANATVKLPGSATSPLTDECRKWSTEAAFANQGALDSAFGNGNYTITAFTMNDGTRAPVLSVSGNNYPSSAPHVASFTAAQSVNPTNSFTLTWDPFPGGTANDFVLVQVDNASGNNVFETPFFGETGSLTGLSNSVTIPANNLPPGQTCQASIIFARGSQTTNNSAYPGVRMVAAYFKGTGFDLVTIGTPENAPPQLIAPHPQNGSTNVPVNSSIAFSFDEPMRFRQAINWSANLDPNKFDYVWTPDRQTVICIYRTNLPANATITWELNPANSCNGFEDLSGNMLTPFPKPALTGSFTTGNTGAGAKDVRLYGCGKQQQFTQTTSAVPSVTNRLAFEAFAQLSGPYTITGASMRPPTGAAQSLSADPYSGGNDFEFGQEFSTQASLDSTFPNGNYVLTLDCVHDGTKVVTNSLPANAYPNVPHASNFNQAQAVNPNQNFALTWDAFMGGTTNDFIQVSVRDDLDNDVFATPDDPLRPGALNGTNTSVVISAGTLTAGRTYHVDLMFAKIIAVNTNGYPGAIGVTFYSRRTQLSLITVAIHPTLSEPARLSPTLIQFRLNGTAGQNYTLQASSDPLGSNNWFNLLTTNAPSNSFLLVDPTATNSQRFYRARVEP